MNVNFEVKVNFQEKELQNFLFDELSNKYKLEPTVPIGFTFDEKDILINDKNKYSAYKDTIEFLVKEFWSVQQENISETEKNYLLNDKNEVVVVYGQEIEFNPEYRLYFKEGGVNDDVKSKIRDIIKIYDFQKDGEFIDWLKIKIDEDDKLSEDFFIIDTLIQLTKVNKKKEIDVTQRDALLKLYNDNTSPQLNSKVDLIPGNEETLFHWAKSLKIKITKTGEELAENFSPITDKNEIEVPKGELNNLDIDNIVDGILGVLFPSDCGEMRAFKEKLLTLFGWPEFKIDWQDIEIKIGCSKIIISVPVLKTRNASLVFYIYYQLPVNVDNTLKRIAFVCAERAALAGCVLGIITSNPAAAIIAFGDLFERCILEEVKKCLDPGILTIKEVDDWK